MAQRPKGERAQVGPRLPLEVYEVVCQRAEENNMSISQYVADVMALHVGRPDLVLELGKPRVPTVREQEAMLRRERQEARRKKQQEQEELPLAG